MKRQTGACACNQLSAKEERQLEGVNARVHVWEGGALMGLEKHLAEEVARHHGLQAGHHAGVRLSAPHPMSVPTPPVPSVSVLAVSLGNAFEPSRNLSD